MAEVKQTCLSPEMEMIRLCMRRDTHFEQLRALVIDKRVNVGRLEKTGFSWAKSLLCLLCEHNESDSLCKTVELFLNNGFDVNYQDKLGYNALLLLFLRRNKIDLDLVRLLIDRGVDVNYVNSDINHGKNCGNNALFLLCSHYKGGNVIDIIKLLIHSGINVNYKMPSNNDTILMWLCRHYKEDNLMNILLVLIDHGINLYCTDVENEWNALQIFKNVQPNNKNFKQVCRFLELSMFGNCAQAIPGNHFTSSLPDEVIVQVFKRLSPKTLKICTQVCRRWRTLARQVLLPVQKSLRDVIQNKPAKTERNLAAISSEFKRSGVHADGRNALHLMCVHHKSPLLPALIRLATLHSKDIVRRTSATDKYGRTGLHLLCLYNHTAFFGKVASILCQISIDGDDLIDVDARDVDGRTALHLLFKNLLVRCSQSTRIHNAFWCCIALMISLPSATREVACALDRLDLEVSLRSMSDEQLLWLGSYLLRRNPEAKDAVSSFLTMQRSTIDLNGLVELDIPNNDTQLLGEWICCSTETNFLMSHVHGELCPVKSNGLRGADEEMPGEGGGVKNLDFLLDSNQPMRSLRQILNHLHSSDDGEIREDIVSSLVNVCDPKRFLPQAIDHIFHSSDINARDANDQIPLQMITYSHLASGSERRNASEGWRNCYKK